MIFTPLSLIQLDLSLINIYLSSIHFEKGSTIIGITFRMYFDLKLHRHYLHKYLKLIPICKIIGSITASLSNILQSPFYHVSHGCTLNHVLELVLQFCAHPSSANEVSVVIKTSKSRDCIVKC